jgi:hypothetical protein
MTPKRCALTTALPVILCLLSVPATPQSQPTRYEVEVIVFRAGGELEAGVPASAEPGAALQGTSTPVKRLTDTASRLRAAGGYRVLAHSAWTQAPAAWNSRRGVSAMQVGLDSAGLQGTVILERGQYLHLGFDLRYREGDREVVLDEVRRVKVNERNYFDNASIGVIAIVTPVS